MQFLFKCVSKFDKLIAALNFNLRGKPLQRREAVQVLREICECIPNESAVSYVFLEQTKNASESKKKRYNLHIRMHVDEAARESIETVTRKRGLSLRESKGDLVVSTLEAPVEIFV